MQIAINERYYSRSRGSASVCVRQAGLVKKLPSLVEVVVVFVGWCGDFYLSLLFYCTGVVASMSMLDSKAVKVGQRIFSLSVFALVITGSAYAQVDTGGNIESTVTGFMESAQTLMMTISSILAVIAFLGLAFMYLGSSLPIISSWKKNNPDAFNNVLIGLGILLFVSGGAVTFLVTGS